MKARRDLCARHTGAIASALLLAASALSAQRPAVETVIVAPGSQLVPRVGADLVVEAAWDDEEPSPIDQQLLAPQTGERRLTLRSRDRAGVRSQERRLLIRVDGSGPRLELGFEPTASADGGWAAPGAEVTLHAEDDSGTIAESSLDVVASGQSAPTGGSSAQTRLTLSSTSGAVTLAATATDGVGNRTDRRFEVRIDADSPQAEIVIDGASAISRRGWTLFAPALTLRLVAEDEESGVRRATLTVDGRQVDGVEWSGTLDHGSHRVEAVVVDQVGNRATATRRFEVDALGPEIQWEPADPAARRSGRRGGRLAAVATDPDAGGAKLEWAVSPEGPWRAYEIGEGPTRSPVFFRAEDLLGNRSDLEVDWKAQEREP